MEWKIFYKRLQTSYWLILIILSCASYLLMSPPRAFGVMIGGIIIIANFNASKRSICNAFSGHGLMISSKAPLIAKFYLRLGALAVVVYLLIAKGVVDPIGFAVGLSTIVLAILATGIYMALKIRAGEAI
ncbi:MAG: ATP synthase subunit I [Deltaproteobacteria bacterium]|nr:ATP synthase subunit I [Deltaproteobacteria bacterium]MBW2301553.1 ATP synthase subunit I [Deltaproteobacteria bacterium]RLB34586.1 MAG: hypothetical protein DRH11_05580 [Deltaproteobacteria bacterium]